MRIGRWFLVTVVVALLGVLAEGSTARSMPKGAGVNLEDDGWIDCAGDEVPLDWDNAQLGSAAFWQEGITGEGVMVAVIDSGVDGTHPAFSRAGGTAGYARG
jgi:subtilisin family serine protease